METGRMEVVYVDGSTEVVDLVIGADGLHSRVRRFVAEGFEATFE